MRREPRLPRAKASNAPPARAWSPRTNVSLERLGALVDVEQGGTIAAAAERDPVRQSQLSRQLSELARGLGVPLTRKVGREAVLTDDARRLSRAARAFFTELQRTQARQPQRLAVSLGAGDSVLQGLVLPALGQLGGTVTRAVSVAAYSDTAALEALDRGLLDAVVLRAEPPSGWQRHPLGALSYGVFARRDCKGGLGELLAREPVALQTSDRALLGHLRELHGELEVALQCETFSQAREAVRSGAFVSVLPRFMGAALPEAAFRCLPWPELDERYSRLWWAQSPTLATERPELDKVLKALRKTLVGQLAGQGR